MTRIRTGFPLLLLAIAACAPRNIPSAPVYDVVIRGGTIYDGLGGKPYVGDVGIIGDRVRLTGSFGTLNAKQYIDAQGMAVAPGFINMLSWATESLLADGRSQSDIRQGVTLEVMGEGWSMGPLSPAMRDEMREQQGDIRYDVAWTTLDEYLTHLETRGVACNVASFVGAATVRIHELGYDDRSPTPAELARMQALVRQAMEDGAVGVSTALIYTPACFAQTGELIALAQAAAPYGGLYIAHLRNEGDHLLEAVDEHITVAREAGIAAEIYHLKAAGRRNWGKMEPVIARIEAARTAGLAVTADMYTYAAGQTGLDAAMPPWVQEGGHDAWVARLRDPAIRARVLAEMRAPAVGWESLYQLTRGPEDVILIGFRNPELRGYTG